MPPLVLQSPGVILGDLDFIAKNLPEGVTMHAPKAPSNFSSVPILFSAKPDAPLGKSLTKIDINHNKPDSNVTISGNYRHRVDLVYGPPNNRTYYEGTYDVLPVAVVEPVPFRVKLHTPATPIVRGGSINLKVEVIRDANFTKDVVVKILTKPPGIGASSNIKISSKDSVGYYPLNC